MMEQQESGRLPRWTQWLVLALTLGPIWLVSRDMWDGSIGAYGLERHLWSGIQEWLLPGNWGLMYLEFRLLDILSQASGLPAWLWLKLLLTVSVIGLAIEARLLARDLFRFSDRDSDAASLLTLAFPCWYLLYGSTFVYVVFIWWVFLGWRLVHRSGRVDMQVIGWLLLVCSYQVNSNFVMVFALEAASWLLRGAPAGRQRVRSIAVCSSAVVVYLTLRLVFPPELQYAGYNNVVLPFSVSGLAAWARASAMFATWLPLIVLPAALGWLLSRQRAHPGWRAPLALAALCVGAVFPYIAVGKGAPLFVVALPFGWMGTAQHMGQQVTRLIYMTFDGWSTRHAILLSLPGALTMGALASWMSASDSLTRSARHWRLTFIAVIVVCLAINLGGQATKLERLAQEESIIRALHERAPPPPGRVDMVLLATLRWNLTVYEANYLFWLAYRADRWAVAAWQQQAPERREIILAEREAAITGPSPGHLHYLMGTLPAEPLCRTTLSVVLPPGLDAVDWVYDRLGLSAIPPAVVQTLTTNCP
jgi:hypothetical protein